MKLLVTGASGFIGKAVLKHAAKEGWEVAALIRAEQTETLRTAYPRLTPIVGRMEAPPWQAIERFAPTAAFHAAWIATPGVYWTSPDNLQHLEWSNRFLTRLLDMGIDRAMVLGTSAEYRWGGSPLSETAALEPNSLYARSKCQLYERLEAPFAKKNVRLAWGRVFYPYGAGEPPQKLCSAMASKLLRGERVELRTPWSEKDYIHISDLAGAICLVLNQGFTGPINLGTGRGVRVFDLVRTIARAAGVDESRIGISEDATATADHAVADITALRGLGFEPQVTLDDGLKQLVDSLRPTPG